MFPPQERGGPMVGPQMRDPYRTTPPAPAPPRMVWMKAPTGETKQVPATAVDFFRKNGAVLLGEPDYQGPVEGPGGMAFAGPIEPPRAPVAQMRAATPEERVVGGLEEAGDPMNAAMVRSQFAGTPNRPETPMSAMRAATMGERFGDMVGNVKQALLPAWMQAEAIEHPQTPEPFHTTVDPTMGSVSPGKVKVPKVAAPKLSHLERAPVTIDPKTGRMVVSNRIPEGPAAAASTETLRSGLREVKSDPDLMKRMAARLRKYPSITEKQAAMNDEGVIDAAVDTFAQNKSFLIGELREHGPRAAKWYNGANRVSTEASAATGWTPQNPRTGYSPDQTSAAIANLSPKKDWHQNAELAKRYIADSMIFAKEDPTFTRELFDQYSRTSTESLITGMPAKIKKGTITPQAAQELINNYPLILQKEARAWVDRPYSALPIKAKARFMRAFDEVSRPQRDYPILTPEGDISHMAVTKEGKPGKLSPAGYGAMEKMISVFGDGSPENISKALGNKHKVRGFFNNINVPEWVEPGTGFGTSTIDTHDIGGSNLLPIGLDNPIVKQGMGGTASKALGIQSLNPLYQEAQQVATRVHNLLARQGQSVGWEGVKGLFTPEMKRSKKFMDTIQTGMAEYRKGQITLNQLQERIINEAGGINTPEWALPRAAREQSGRHTRSVIARPAGVPPR